MIVWSMQVPKIPVKEITDEMITQYHRKYMEHLEGVRVVNDSSFLYGRRLCWRLASSVSVADGYIAD